MHTSCTRNKTAPGLRYYYIDRVYFTRHLYAPCRRRYILPILLSLLLLLLILLLLAREDATSRRRTLCVNGKRKKRVNYPPPFYFNFIIIFALPWNTDGRAIVLSRRPPPPRARPLSNYRGGRACLYANPAAAIASSPPRDRVSRPCDVRAMIIYKTDFHTRTILLLPPRRSSSHFVLCSLRT